MYIYIVNNVICMQCILNMLLFHSAHPACVYKVMSASHTLVKVCLMCTWLSLRGTHQSIKGYRGVTSRQLSLCLCELNILTKHSLPSL